MRAIATHQTKSATNGLLPTPFQSRTRTDGLSIKLHVRSVRDDFVNLTIARTKSVTTVDLLCRMRRLIRVSNDIRRAELAIRTPALGHRARTSYMIRDCQRR